MIVRIEGRKINFDMAGKEGEENTRYHRKSVQRRLKDGLNETLTFHHVIQEYTEKVDVSLKFSSDKSYFFPCPIMGFCLLGKTLFHVE
jgi:hypothetical protein